MIDYLKFKFFCDENITRQRENTIKDIGFEVDSVV
jgi:hypothetical protein